MALTGLVLIGFVLGHLLGNLLMFKGPAALNEYAKWLHDHPGLIWTARTVLLISVFAHIWVGIKLSLENKASRDGGPAVDATRRASLGSRTMPYSGVVILGFIVFHLLHFTFKSVAVFYIISMLLLCLHLSHGVSSVFQTLGLRNERWRGRLDALAQAYAWFIALGFISIPLAVLTGCLK